MRFQLSSSLTFFYKFVFSTVWTAGFSLGTLAMALRGDRNALLFGIVTVFGGVVLLAFCVPLKRVIAVDDGLLVSNFLTEEHIPYSDILEVRERRWINIRPVVVSLRRPCAFGEWFLFMPYTKFFLMFWNAHPVADFLRERMEGAQQRTRTF